ncbi:MAG: hypothetical protein U0R49_07715 [Fimbriimonadales bacterium]
MRREAFGRTGSRLEGGGQYKSLEYIKRWSGKGNTGGVLVRMRLA